jgi:hypothetical protein
METKIKKIVISSLLAAVLLFGAAGSTSAQYQNQAELSVQIAEIKRQIIILQIQLIQMRIADLQQQYNRLIANNGNNGYNPNVTNAYIDLISPSGGEYITSRGNYNIRWDSHGVGSVTIELDTPESGRIIAENVVAADGRYNWYTGDIAGSNYRIRIFDPTRPNISSISRSVFSVYDKSAGNRCSDGTLEGKCSVNKPGLCFDANSELVDACHSCGCPSGQSCGSDSSCH